MSKFESYVKEFILAYIAAALWSTIDDTEASGKAYLDDNYGIEDLAPSTKSKVIEDCMGFIEEVDQAGLGDVCSPSQMGHDFWLTRNGHGAGFWDRGLGEAGKQLTGLCKHYDEINLYAGDDKKLYFSGYEDYPVLENHLYPWEKE